MGRESSISLNIHTEYATTWGAARPTGTRHAGRDGLKLSVDAAMNADPKRARVSAAAMPTWRFSCAAWLCPSSCKKERAKMVIPCEPQIRCMRASDTTYVAEEVEAFLSRENKSGSGLCSPSLLFFLQSCTPCVLSSISALAPFLGGSSTKRCGFSGSAVQPGLQFSLE